MRDQAALVALRAARLEPVVAAGNARCAALGCLQATRRILPGQRWVVYGALGAWGHARLVAAHERCAELARSSTGKLRSPRPGLAGDLVVSAWPLERRGRVGRRQKRHALR
jgi:hypothetical protein